MEKIGKLTQMSRIRECNFSFEKRRDTSKKTYPITIIIIIIRRNHPPQRSQ